MKMKKKNENDNNNYENDEKVIMKWRNECMVWNMKWCNK